MTTRLGLFAALGVCCGGALADLQYGDGTVKPMSDRWVYAHAATAGDPAEQEVRTRDNLPFEAQAAAESSDVLGSHALGFAYQNSTMSAEALTFSLRASSSSDGPFHAVENGALIDTWIHTDRQTGFSFFSPEVFYYINTIILREDDTLVPVEFVRIGDLSIATGTLSAGWYHVQLNVGGRFTRSDGMMYGWIGVPGPGTAVPVGMAALVGRRRRRV